MTRETAQIVVKITKKVQSWPAEGSLVLNSSRLVQNLFDHVWSVCTITKSKFDDNLEYFTDCHSAAIFATIFTP